MRSIALLLGVVLGCFPLTAVARDKNLDWTPQRMIHVKKVSGVQVSPDGKRVVYAVREAILDDGKSEFRTHLFLTNDAGDDTVHLTKGDKSCDEPQWSPDGKWIAFLSARGGKKNIWITDIKGSEPQQVSNAPSAVTSYKWSPDSAWIAYTATDAPTPAETKAKKEKNDARIVDENYKMSRLYVTDLPSAGRKVERLLTKGDFNVPATGRAGFDWSPDGKTIVFTRTKTPLADDWTTSDLQFVEVATGELRSVLPSGPVRHSPHFSPDGKMIAFVEAERTWAGSGRVHVLKRGDEAPRPLSKTFDGWGRYSELLGWNSAGDAVYFTEVRGTISRLGQLNLDGSLEQRAVDGFASAGIHLNTTRTRFGLTWETRSKAPEPCTSGFPEFEPVAVAKVNREAPILPPGLTELAQWKSKDGMDIQGLLTYPAGYKKGQRYPLLLVIHGGPMGVFTDSYVASPGLYPIAAFSSRGYFVLRPNPRGSSGYGKKFRHANYGDWGGGDYHDLMTGVDHVIKMGLADENRLGVMGWSYGGYMTSWIVTQTKRFKAASCGAGVTNLMSFTGTADIPSFLPDYFAGEFWDKPDVYRKHSAMFNVKGVTTPTLIQHGERDERVPLSQGLEFYNALKRQGCTTKMVIYPRTPHGIEEPRLLVDCMERNLEWFDQYVGKAK